MNDGKTNGAMVPEPKVGARRDSTLGIGSQPSAINDNRASDVRFSQYYTREAVARKLYAVFCQRFDPTSFLMVEPSAGNGSFLRILPVGTRAFDVDPRCAGIETADFLTVWIRSDKPIAIIGNPPFSNGMAIRFFNHAASQAQIVALILPRSFRKAAIENRLDRYFHLLHEEVVEKDAFIFRSKPFDVPAVFQIWVRRAVRRELRDAPTTHPDFEFLRTADDADFAIQRVGARAGRVHRELQRSREAHYFVRANHPGVLSIMRQLEFGSVTGDVAGNPSLAKTEIVSLYADWIEGLDAAATRASALDKGAGA